MEVEDLLRLYRGKDFVEVFCKHVKSEAKRLYNMFPERPMKGLTEEEWREFNGATKCHICFNDFEEDDNVNYKVRDHCYYVGLYRGPAHRICNLRYKIPRHIPVVFHNQSGYDMPLFIRELWKKFDFGSIRVIAKNKEKYINFNISVTVDEYKDMWGATKEKKIQPRFIGTIRFMVSSLDSLARNLVGVNRMVCKRCGSEAELIHIDENYVSHGTCGKCRDSSHWKLAIDPIFDNLRVGHMDEQF